MFSQRNSVKYMMSIKMDGMILIYYANKMNIHNDIVILYIVNGVIVSSYESNLHLLKRRKRQDERECCCLMHQLFFTPDETILEA